MDYRSDFAKDNEVSCRLQTYGLITSPLGDMIGVAVAAFSLYSPAYVLSNDEVLKVILKPLGLAKDPKYQVARSLDFCSTNRMLLHSIEIHD